MVDYSLQDYNNNCMILNCWYSGNYSTVFDYKDFNNNSKVFDYRDYNNNCMILDCWYTPMTP